MDGPIGASGQSVEVNVDRVYKRETGLVPTPDHSTEGETAVVMGTSLAHVAQADHVLVSAKLGCSRKIFTKL